MTTLAVVVLKDGAEVPVNASEVRTLLRCGLLARIAVNGRWHTDAPDAVREVLDSLRNRATHDGR